MMDYPPPFVKLNAAGVPDLSDAYATGIGAWDKIAINFGYREFPAGSDEKAPLDAILRSATTSGFIFISDSDARPEGGAHPFFVDLVGAGPRNGHDVQGQIERRRLPLEGHTRHLPGRRDVRPRCERRAGSADPPRA